MFISELPIWLKLWLLSIPLITLIFGLSGDRSSDDLSGEKTDEKRRKIIRSGKKMPKGIQYWQFVSWGVIKFPKKGIVKCPPRPKPINLNEVAA